MNAIELLMEEHRLIEEVIDGLFGFASSADAPAEDLTAFVAFIQGFADAHHHGKEEDILFRAMTDHGMPSDTGPLAVMLHEHAEGRGYTGILAEIAARGPELDADSRGELAHAAQGYGNLLRAHIQKEDQVLYPMADQMLPEATWTEIEKAFTAFEQDEANAARARDLRASAQTLIARYAPSAD